MDIEAIVVGSGFGGAVAALRLGQAGVRTLVLERGRRWPIRPSGDTFAPSSSPDRRTAWFRTSWGGRPIERYAGVRDMIEGNGMTATQGAGVGGGSLVYAAFTYQPSREMFRRALGDGIDYDAMDRVFYPRVRAMLKASPIPDDVLAAPCAAGARRFIEQAKAAGFHARRLDMAIDWDIVREEIAGEREPSWIVGEFTTNSGAKNTLDRNYLALAEDAGPVDIRPLHRVTAIAERKGGYRISFEAIDELGAVIARDTVDCRLLFLAAGSIGTSTLLLRARSKGTLGRLGEDVGRWWGGNGDRFVPIAEERRMITGVSFEHLDNPHGPVVVEDTPDVRFVMTCDGVGALRYDPERDDVALEWPADDSAIIAATRASAYTNQILETRNGLPPFATHVTSRTVHPLGGAVIGHVCDSLGRVLGYDGLYVVDGALLPGTSGCANPSLTIAALAERALEQIVHEAR
ncbi:MAG TPA: GMC oxidoreductase [Burkholderiales bacterium]|jgi:cholesterol oxidase